MFFKKKKIKQKEKCKVLFKQKYPSRSIKRKNSAKSFLIKSKPLKRKSNPRREKIKKMQTKNRVLNILFLIFILFFIGFVVHTTINFITSIRGGTTVDQVFYDKTYVEGMESVPIYPNSEFVYQDRKDEEIVLRMLNQGISVYRLPRNTKSSDVYEYYEEKLAQSDWDYILTIPISTEEKLFGQYWIKGEKGLRIYVENNDVWYELLTRNEANNALNERRGAEIQRKRILESSTEQTLLPDYPWILSIPREYLTRYSSTDIGELQSVEIFEIGGESKFLIYPIGRSNTETYDALLHNFVTKKSEEEGETWEIINTRQDFQKEREVLIARLLINEQEGEGIVLINKRNFVIYAIIANQKEHPFFEEIITNIHEP